MCLWVIIIDFIENLHFPYRNIFAKFKSQYYIDRNIKQSKTLYKKFPQYLLSFTKELEFDIKNIQPPNYIEPALRVTIMYILTQSFEMKHNCLEYHAVFKANGVNVVLV